MTMDGNFIVPSLTVSNLDENRDIDMAHILCARWGNDECAAMMDSL